MIIDNKTGDEKLQYDIYREATKIYQHYHLEKLVSMNILKVKKYYFLIKVRTIEQTKFTYSRLEKALEKQTKQLKIKVDITLKR